MLDLDEKTDCSFGRGGRFRAFPANRNRALSFWHGVARMGLFSAQDSDGLERALDETVGFTGSKGMGCLRNPTWGLCSRSTPETGIVDILGNYVAVDDGRHHHQIPPLGRRTNSWRRRWGKGFAVKGAL